MSRRLMQILIFLLTPLLIVVGFSSWIIVGEKSETVGINAIKDENEIVCYINTNTKGNQYTRIEKALEVANSLASEASKQIVYVRPGTNPTIYKDCIIGDYVTLCVPFNGTTHYLVTDSSAEDFNWGSGQVFSDNNPQQYRKNLITVKENVNINILSHGVLQIGGVFGNPDVGITGIVNGDYCQLNLERNAKIISNGIVECYGFIKESELNNNSILEIKSGILKMPFMIYDFKGGTLTLSSHNENVCPFSIYDLANIQSLLRIHSGSLIQAEYRLKINDEPFFGPINLIGDNNTANTALRLTKGYMDIKYGGFTPNGTPLTVVEGQTKFNLVGDLSISSIIMTVRYNIIGSIGATVNLDTSNYFFPIPYKIKFIVEEKSILTISEKVKMMPGSSIYIKENGVMNVNNNIIFYPENYSETREAAKESNYPSNLSAAKLTNNGKITINTSGSLGIAGSTNVINVDKVDAVIEVYNNSSITSNDEIEGENFGTTHSHKQEISGTLMANVTLNNVSASRISLEGSIYESIKLSDGSIAWKKIDIPSTPISINYYSVYNDGTTELLEDHNNPSSALATENIVLKTPSKSGYIFKGWYLDMQCTKLINNGQLSGLAMLRNSINGVINIYACWEKGVSVNIEYRDANDRKITSIEQLPVAPGSSIILANGYENYEIINSGLKTIYSFEKWVIDDVEYFGGSTYNVPKELDDGSTIVIKEKAKETIYAQLSYTSNYSATNSFGSTVRSATVKNNDIPISPSSEIWVLVGSTITINASGKGGWLASYSIKVNISGVDTYSEGASNVGEKKTDSFTISFKMPKNAVSIAIANG